MTQAPDPADRDGRASARHTPGTPCWVSLMVHDMTATQGFYGELFGWEFEPGPAQLGPYVRARLDGRQVAGIGLLPPDRHLPVAWTPYLASDDVDVTAETVRLCGGTVGVGPLDAGEVGRLVLGSDPSGAVFGVWQVPGERGGAAGGRPGAPLWNELRTFETANVAKFYASLFGYEERRPESGGAGAGEEAADRVTLCLDGRPVAGILGAGPALRHDGGPHWLTYFEVADTDAAVERLTGLGGRVVAPAHDTARGRTATVTDPEGARFAVLQRGGTGADGRRAAG
ncbi:glyoxalase/bleomycin resistance protein/dioxygenase [Streptomyces sp. Tu 6176]|uniref:VOC family protein n=1 Tax=Streptomyces sp. Tu 6176 TaxID=1470557 RepID=UPI000452504F|nr:VOC family protein [Streptomyces sp. Tu 6176]EYT83396.1 glyoxalase/bleomycin resistance protein/dioxygenase [Streptomyces sp. Tu 6176]